MRASDLTAKEQTNVRTALRFLRAQHGGWKPVAKALQQRPQNLAKIAKGAPVGARTAIGIAHLSGASVDDVLTGRYPSPRACPNCGYCPSDFVDEETQPGI